MKKVKILLVLTVFSIFINVKAADNCPTEEMNRLKELANKVEFKLDYNMQEFSDEEFFKKYNKNPFELVHKIQVYNMDDDLKIYYKTDLDNDYTLLNVTDFENKTFFGNKKISFNIYSYVDNDCNNKLLKSNTINFPIYNMYYYINKEKCANYPEFEYCREWLDNDNNYTIEQIDSLLNKYIKDNSNQNKNNKISVLNNYLTYIFVGLGIVVALTIVLIIKKVKTRRKQLDI